MRDLRLTRLSTNAAIRLGEELGRGGEGAVFPVEGESGLVAKIYLRPPTPEKGRKLLGMTQSASPDLLKVAAWPVDLLADETGAVRGFLMPRVSAREDLHELYSPKSRRRAFPNADFRFLVRVATNLARAFAQVHAQGGVIGDVNHGNALVGRDGTVLLIDCDSFQVRDREARVFTCDVGVPLFTPPELHGQVFRGLRRTPDHDAFGLAVLLFHMLFLGRHPYAGKHVSGEMPIERAIAEHRFAYGARAHEFGMTPPPGTLPLDIFGQPLAQLFERAFAPPGAPRPAPREWIDALAAFEHSLVPCEDADTHFHPRGQECCWCTHEQLTGMRVFGRQVAEALTAGAQKIAKLWDEVKAVRRPAKTAPLEPPEVVGSAAAKDALGPIPRLALAAGFAGMAIKALVGAGGLLTGAGLIGLAYIGAAGGLIAYTVNKFRKGGRPAELHLAVNEAREQLASLIERWNQYCDDKRFDELREQLEVAHRRLTELPKLRAARIRALADDASKVQLDRFLSLHMIDKAKLPEVGEQEAAMLASYGIDSADDVLRQAADVEDIVGRPAAAALSRWANDCAALFKFDPMRGLDPQEVREIDELLSAQQQKLLSTLRHGGARLKEVADDIQTQRADTRRQLEAARVRLRKAEMEMN